METHGSTFLASFFRGLCGWLEVSPVVADARVIKARLW